MLSGRKWLAGPMRWKVWRKLPQGRAAYCEFMLTIDRDAALDRCVGRSSSGGVTAVQRGIDSIVADHGGAEFLARVYAHVHDFLKTRPSCTVINTTGMNPHWTLGKVQEALAAQR
jgi:hypothetical protein